MSNEKEPAKKPKGRSPDYRLKRLNKDTGDKVKVGAAWINQDRSITVVIDPGVILTGDPRAVLTLFPFD